MIKLAEAVEQKLYQVKEVAADQEIKQHLHNLGLIPGSKVVLLKGQGQNGIVLLHNVRLALDQAVLQQIMVEEVMEEVEWLPLAELKVGQSAKVVSIHGEGPVKRRLMDMGLTKNVQVTVRKLAPLGDPIEINLRGYELSLRKNEAEYILVERKKD